MSPRPARNASSLAWPAWLGASVVPLALAAALAAPGSAQVARPPTSPKASAGRWAVDATRYLADVRALAADDMEGRGDGEPGLERAAEHVAGGFAAAGLSPAGDNGSWFQSFTLEVLGQHYYPLSEMNAVDAPPPAPLEGARVVFGGYAISAPALGYDDFAGLEVKGAAVVAFAHEPQENDPSSVFDGRQLTPHADVGAKAS
jgi:hypothetical protein